MMPAKRMALRARYTGNKEVVYRWIGQVGAGRLARAQNYEGATIEGLDTWSDDADPRMKRATKVSLDVPDGGLLVLESCSASARGGRTYTAAILDPARDPKDPLDWKRAKWVEMIAPDAKSAGQQAKLIHVIEVDGKRGRYEVDNG